MADHTPYQRKIIDRYYKNFDAIKFQRLSELATDLYLAEGKKRDRLWSQVRTACGSSSSRRPASHICCKNATRRCWSRSSRNWKAGRDSIPTFTDRSCII